MWQARHRQSQVCGVHGWGSSGFGQQVQLRPLSNPDPGARVISPDRPVFWRVTRSPPLAWSPGSDQPTKQAGTASRREGLGDRFTVRRLGVGGRLAASLTNTNCIESMISIARDTTKNVKRWRDGKMLKRWCAAGVLNAERSFRRLKGYRQMPTFVAALARHLEAVPPAWDAARVA